MCVQVFPIEYQRALRQLAEEAAREKVQHTVNGNDSVKPDESKIKDIEESVLDGAFEKKRLEKILDKTRQVPELACTFPYINLIVFYFIFCILIILL